MIVVLIWKDIHVAEIIFKLVNNNFGYNIKFYELET